jgi:tRNA A-37 threonylcarbamoyl transferase component Bud32
VTEALEGFVSLDALQTDAATDRRALAQKVGTVIGTLHRARLQHSCLYDKHIMVRGQGAAAEVALIDLEKLRRPLLPWRAAAHDLDQLSRHQALWDDGDWRALLAAHAVALRGSGQPA